MKIKFLGPPPKPSSKSVSNVMKANVSKNTEPEMMMREAFSKAGLKGYNLHSENIPGRPDIAFVRKRIAIFVNGCFWHRCPYCKLSLPKTHTDFWKRKFERNKERDKRKRKMLEKDGWKVFEFWECMIKKNPYKYAERVKEYAGKRRL